MQKKILFVLLLIISLLSNFCTAQDIEISKIEPPNWWAGMKWNEVQLMVYGKNLNKVRSEFDSPEIIITSIDEVENSDYTFINIKVPEKLSKENFTLTLSNENSKAKTSYKILNRSNSPQQYQGFNPKDIIYLVMPDRFVNGDLSNDEVEGFEDSMQGVEGQKRYGGDIQGIIDNLDYLKDLGFNTLWLNPVVENNTFRSYHGYAATDLYNVDARLGTKDLYKDLVAKAHEKDMKIILDHVSNHISDDHPWLKSLPTKTWINGTIKNHLPAAHQKMVFTDPHSDSLTIKEVQEGWFVDTMPDLNQADPLLAKYIIQNTIWWVEYTGLDGIREDTYPYCNQLFMSNWAKAVLNEYPTLNIVGEVWTGNPVFLAGYQSGSKLRKNFDTNLPALTDFGFRDAAVEYLSGRKSITYLYETLTQDYLYPNPTNLITFLDNHDVGRIMFTANGNVDKVKQGYVILLTTRGIPQILYGSEIGMKLNDDHGTLRKKFPDGTGTDKRNALVAENRTDYENDIFNFIKKIITIRNNSPALSTGTLTHFPPVNDVYIYFREDKDEKILVIINGSENTRHINLDKYKKNTSGYTKLVDLFNNSELTINSKIELNEFGWKIYRLEK